jgi:hypothetical protein
VTEVAARRVANAVLASAGLAAAVVVITTPPLRRLASHALRHWLGGMGVTAYLANQTINAWQQSRRPGPAPPPA